MRRLALVAVMLAGCVGDTIKIATHKFDAAAAAAAALAQFDANKDGTLSEKELEKSPGLQALARALGKPRLTAADVRERCDGYARGDGGVVAVACAVTLDGTPLAGATVTFSPEPFMSVGFGDATGTTDKNGAAVLKLPSQPVPGLHPGLYRVTVSKLDGGKEAVPAKYNSKTTLGHEVPPPGSRGAIDATFPLTSR